MCLQCHGKPNEQIQTLLPLAALRNYIQRYKAVVMMVNDVRGNLGVVLIKIK